MSGPWTSVKVLITARTYPVPAKKGTEISCTAGITEDGRWIRLFPIPYRMLQEDQRFAKYQWIRARVRKASDFRLESYTVDLDSITIDSGPLPTSNDWSERRSIIEPLRATSLCALKAERDANKRFPTLGLIKPREIKRLVLEPDSPDWTEAQRGILRRESMFDKLPEKELEKIPFKFRYEFLCEAPDCRGHDMSCTDWEMHQSYRKWRVAYGADWEVKFREMYEQRMTNGFDTSFFVGTTNSHPDAWIVVGLFYPPKAPVGGRAAQLKLI